MLNLKNINNIFKSVAFGELLIVIVVILLSFYYLGEEKIKIKSDGKGYYEYLPATFIYNDLGWKYLDTLNTPGYYKHSEYNVGAIKGSGDDRHNKYFVGTSILMSPFFFAAHIYAKIKNENPDGYSKPYQDAMWVSALFYLFIGLVFLRKVLSFLNVRILVIFITQILIVFSTPLFNYLTFEPTFSHVYSFAVISAVFYCWCLFVRDKKNTQLYFFGILAGLVFLIRPTNILVIPMLLFVFKSFKQALSFLKYLWENKRAALIITILISAIVVAQQNIVWFIQKGSFIIDSYGKETFDFKNPQIFNILFSYKKGLFVYSPVLFLGALLGLFYAFVNKRYFSIISVLIPFFVLTYILSSWWSWWYGMSFGQRSYIDILIVFAIAIAYGLNKMNKKAFAIVLPFFLFTIPITIIQTFQYKSYILHWDSMDKDGFWEVFLKTEDRYRGVFWREKKMFVENQIVFKPSVKKNITIPKNTSNTVLEVYNLNSIIQESFDMVEFSCDMKDNNSGGKVVLSIQKHSGENVFWDQIYTYHETRGKEEKKGASFQFQVNKELLKNAHVLYLVVESQNEKIVISNAEVKFVSFDENLDNSSYTSKVARKKQELLSNKSVLQELKSNLNYRNMPDNEVAEKEAIRLVEREDKIKLLKEKMMASPEWIRDIKNKAKQQGKSIEEMMDIDAKYILDTDTI